MQTLVEDFLQYLRHEPGQAEENAVNLRRCRKGVEFWVERE